MSKGLSRRSFLRAGTAAGIGVLGSQFSRFDQLARAQSSADHFFLFIELKGGVAWQYATDGYDLARLRAAGPKVLKLVELAADGTTPPLTAEEQAEILEVDGATMNHGNIAIVPYIDTPEASYKTGTTNHGCTYRLGISGHALAPYVNDIAVVRGVRGLHNFHGGANDEAWSGIFDDHEDQSRKHMAGTIAAHLAAQKGAVLLDNLVFEGATFPGKAGPDFSNPMRIDVRSLGILAAAQTGSAPASAEKRFTHARQLSQALGSSRALGPQHKEAFAAYVAALEKAPAIQKRLAAMAARFGSDDASLNLDLQVDTVLPLFTSGLTRVATLCLGSSNGRNNVDGFGLFDAHYGLVHRPAATDVDRRRTYGHHMNVEGAMRSIARLIGLLKSTMHRGKSLFEQTTVVVTSEFSRPTNAAGNEDGEGMFGAGHYNYNNNVLLFGKGVRGGTWLGQNDFITQYAHLAQMDTLDQPDPSAVKFEVPSFFTLDPEMNTWNVPEDAMIDGMPIESEIDFVSGAKRPIMAKDVIRTVYEIGGLTGKFRESYAGRFFGDARALRPVVA